MLLQVASVHIAGQAVVVGEQEMEGISVGGLERKLERVSIKNILSYFLLFTLETQQVKFLPLY